MSCRGWLIDLLVWVDRGRLKVPGPATNSGNYRVPVVPGNSQPRNSISWTWRRDARLLVRHIFLRLLTCDLFKVEGTVLVTILWPGHAECFNPKLGTPTRLNNAADRPHDETT